jgi:hypothetical protein
MSRAPEPYSDAADIGRPAHIVVHQPKTRMASTKKMIDIRCSVISGKWQLGRIADKCALQTMIENN